MIDFNALPDLSKEKPDLIAKYLLSMIDKHIPNSSTRLSLREEGYPADGKIETTIREYQTKYPGIESGYHALVTGCGNCQDMAYAGALILRAAGFRGRLAIGEFGINHRFLFVDDMIVDPWSQMCCLEQDWKENLNAYGGAVKDGVMKGRILSSKHEELEEEVPEIVEKIPQDVNFILEKYGQYGRIKESIIVSSIFASQRTSSDQDPMDLEHDDHGKKSLPKKSNADNF